MKEFIKSYGATVGVVLVTIGLIVYFAPESVKHWFRI